MRFSFLITQYIYYNSSCDEDIFRPLVPPSPCLLRDISRVNTLSNNDIINKTENDRGNDNRKETVNF